MNNQSPKDRSNSGSGERFLYAPPIPKKDAVRRGVVDGTSWDRATEAAQNASEYHHRAGTPRSAWELRRADVQVATDHVVQEAQSELRRLLHEQVDPLVGHTTEVLGQAQARVEFRARGASRVTVAEGGRTMPGQEGVSHAGQLQGVMEQDHQAGRMIHDRSPRWVKWLAKAAPVFEFGGLMTFLAWNYDLDLLHPWRQLMLLLFVTAVVVALIVIQMRTMVIAGREHNDAREVATMPGTRNNVAALRRSRNRRLAIGAGIAAVVTVSMIYRSIAALGDASLTLTLILVAMSIATGVALPLSVFWAHAYDGSRTSRRYEQLVKDLDADQEAHALAEQEAETLLAHVHEAITHAVRSTLPGIWREVRHILAAAEPVYSFARLQVGHLPEQPEHVPSEDLVLDPATKRLLHGCLTTGIPGASTVDLGSWIDKVNHLQALNDKHEELLAQLRACPPHPWAHGQGSRGPEGEPATPWRQAAPEPGVGTGGPTGTTGRGDGHDMTRR